MAKDVTTVHQPQRSDDRTTATTRRTFLPTFAIAVVSSAVAAPALGHAEQPTQSEAGTVSWNELRTRKPTEVRAFYAGVVGWTPKVVAGYTTFAVGDNEVAGAETIEDSAPADRRPAWLPFIQVKDVDEAAKRAVQLGGRIVKLPFDAENERMAEIEDPEGTQFGLVSPRG
jgi:predicted enzyme related to lactoylglutathione lyase